MKPLCINAVCGLLLLSGVGCAGEKFDANEAILHKDLYSIRASIDQFTSENNRAPESFEELLSHGYLHRIPTDPLTGSSSTWKAVYKDGTELLQDTPSSIEHEIHKHGGIVDVRSGSDKIARDGSRYRDW